MLSRRGFLSRAFMALGAVALAPLLPPVAPAPSLEQKQEILRKYLETAEGRTKLAMSMTAPIRSRLYEQSVMRKVCSVTLLPDQVRA